MTASNHHKIGLTSAILLIIGNVVGAGTFTTTGLMLAHISHPIVILLVWLVAGLVMLCGAGCYGALARQIPESGGEYLFLSRIFHPALGCLAGWASLLVGFSAPIAVCAYALSEYARHWFAFPVSVDSRIVGSTLILLFTCLHSMGTRQGLRIQNLIITIKLILMAIFIFLITDRVAANHMSMASLPSVAEWQADDLAISFIWAFYAYSGWNSVIYIASELKNPQQNLMRATMIGSLLIMLIYLLLNYCTLRQGDIPHIEGRVDYLLLVAEQSGSDWPVIVAAIVVNLALFSSLSALIMVGPHVYAKMAEDGFLPGLLRSQQGRYHNAVIFQGVIALLILWFGTFEHMLTGIGYILGVCCVMTVAGLVKLKLNDRNIAIPFWPYSPAIFITLVTFCIVYHIYHHPIYSLLGIILILPCLLFGYYRKKQGTL